MIGYIITLTLTIFIYIVGTILIIKKWKNINLELVFVLLIFGFYVASVVERFISCGPNDWNFTNTLPTANVSPFMFALIFVTYFLPKRIKTYIYPLISCLSLGFICASLIEIIRNVVINYAFHCFFLFNYISHIVASLFGIYLVWKGEVDLKNIKKLSSAIQ